MRQIYVVGNGNIGREFCRRGSSSIYVYSRGDIDISNYSSIIQAFDNRPIDVIINTASINDMDTAENYPTEAYNVNAIGAFNLARFCCGRNIPLVHISNTSVFGNFGDYWQTPLTEEDRTDPISVYGSSKLAGEHLIRKTWHKHFIIRTSEIYGLGESLVRWVINCEDIVKITDDQTFAPTSAKSLVDKILDLDYSSNYGLYHYANGGSTTWPEFIREIYHLLERDVKSLQVDLEQVQTSAQSPCYAVLNSDRFLNLLDQKQTHWKDDLKCYLPIMLDYLGYDNEESDDEVWH